MENGRMIKHVGIAAALLLSACGTAFAADWESYDSQEMLFVSTDAYMGYGWAVMTDWSGAPWIPGRPLDGIVNCISFSAAYLPRLGPFHVGPRLEAFSATYITGFAKDGMGVEHDQAVIETCLDAYVGFTGLEWLSAFAFAGGTLSYYAVFDPLHTHSGAEEYCIGVRAGAGVSFVPLSIELGIGRLRVSAGPEAVIGLILPTDLLYPYLRVHGLISIQYVFTP
jgi:hypothetical protein